MKLAPFAAKIGPAARDEKSLLGVIADVEKKLTGKV